MHDWHCHLLPGVDDGAGDESMALEMAALLAQAGFSAVYCTPHQIPGLYANTPQLVRNAVIALQGLLDDAGIALRLHTGMEYYLDEYFHEALKDPLLLGETDRLLVEIPSQANPALVREGAFHALRSGLVPLVAHPERSRLLFPLPEGGWLSRWQRRGGSGLLGELRAMGCKFQGNLGSFAGYYGRTVQQRAEELAKAGVYDCFGSDGHDATMLQGCLSSGLEKVKNYGGRHPQ